MKQNKTIYVKLVALDKDEFPLESIEGRATQGSINIDGASAVRRTCSLTLVTSTLDISEYNWAIKTKFQVFVGEGEETVWHKEGVFLISSFSSSYNTNGFTVSIQGKDKMAKLNGEFGGIINSQARFDDYDLTDNGITRAFKLPIKDIIRDCVHQYGEEPFHNIIINDLDMTGLELQEYRYDIPLYLIRQTSSSEYNQATFDWVADNYECADAVPIYDSLIDLEPAEGAPSIFEKEGDQYHMAKIEFGDTAGYKEIDLVYPDELVVGVGGKITDVLDQIKNMLGDFEYFYNVEGQFVFQKKQVFLNTSWSPIVETESNDMPYVDPYYVATPYSYKFTDLGLFTSFGNNPNLAELKNDYTVWGETPGGTPIHMRYALDKRPTSYVTIEGQEYTTENYDWRELIFQMAKDYRKYNHDDDFAQKISSANPDHYPLGKTGYEPYYIDIEGFWRGLYEEEGGWTEQAKTNPIFWFDFLDVTDSDLEQYSVPMIGTRAKAVNDKDVKAIVYKETPAIIFGKQGDKTGYRYFSLSGYDNMFKKSSQGKSARDAISTLLYNHAYCVESVSIQSIPVYELQPNTLIYICDPRANIEGDYIVNKITIPLAYNGNMSISCTKAITRIL